MDIIIIAAITSVIAAYLTAIILLNKLTKKILKIEEEYQNRMVKFVIDSINNKI